MGQNELEPIGLLEESGVDDMVRQFAEAIESRGRDLALPRLPMAAERLAIERRLERLRADLRPAREDYQIGRRTSMEVAMMALGDMFTRYPSMRNDEAAMRCSAYLEDLQDYPVFAILAACGDVKHGRIKGLSPDFPPTGPRIEEGVKRHAGAVRAKMFLAERVLRVQVVLPPPPTPEQERAMASRLAALAEQFRLKREHELEELREKHAGAIRETPGPGATREYQGAEPVYASAGIPISPALARQIEDWRRRDAELKRKPRNEVVL